MRRRALLAVVAGSVLLAACGQPQVVVRAEIESPDPEGEGTMTVPLRDKVVTLLPYDRDLIFDSLAAAAAEPEPEIPDTLLEKRDEVAEAQRQWREAEAQWNAIRDRMKQITTQMEGLNRGERRYRELFQEFDQLENRVQRAERDVDRSFQRFDSLQQTILQQSEELRIRREQWADEAFAEVGEAMERKLRDTGRKEFMDTTNANGVVRFRVPKGQWWVHARHELAYDELYWNVPVEVQADSVLVILNRENAEARPNL